MNYRLKHEVYYNSNLESHLLKNLYFDITSFTYNIVFIEDAYNRFDSQLYAKCIDNKESLLNKIIEATDDRVNRLKSWACIRNAEVLQDFVSYLENEKPKGKREDIEVIKDFFKSASEFEISTYTFVEKSEDHYKISFAFLSIISTFLNSLIPTTTATAPAASSQFDTIFTRSINTQIRLNIRVQLRKNSSYSKMEIWSLLKGKNPFLDGETRYEELYNKVFDRADTQEYSTENAKNLLSEYKVQIEKPII